MEHEGFVGAKSQVALHNDQVVGRVRRRRDPIPVDLLTDHVHLGACEAVVVYIEVRQLKATSMHINLQDPSWDERRGTARRCSVKSESRKNGSDTSRTRSPLIDCTK